MNDILALTWITAKKDALSLLLPGIIEQVSFEALEILLNILDKIEIDLNIEFRSEEALDQNNTKLFHKQLINDNSLEFQMINWLNQKYQLEFGIV